MAFLLLVAGLVFALSQRASATANYGYVAITGVDAGTCGDASSPCRTIQYALSQVPVGGTIDVGPGTFDEPQLVLWNPVTIVGDGASETTIDVNSANPACQGEAEYFDIQYPVTAIGSVGFCSEPSYDGTSPPQSGAYAIDDVTLEGIGGALTTNDPRDYEDLPDNPDLIVSNIPAASTFELSGDSLFASSTIDANIEGDGSVGAILGGDPNSSTSVTDTTFNGMWQAILAYGYSGSLLVTDSTFENLVPLNMDETFVLASGLPWNPPNGSSTETFAPEGLLSMNPGADGGQTGTGMFSVEGSTFTGYAGDGVIAEAGQGYVNRPGGVDGAVIENNTFDLGVASDTLTGTTQPIVIDADQGSTTTSVLISGNTVTTDGTDAEAIALTTALGAPGPPGSSSPGQINTVTISNNSLTATGAGATDVALSGISGSGTEGTISDVSFTGNDLLGNGLGINVSGPTVSSITAEVNYWGNPSGPSGAGPGSGLAVSEDIDYANWCTTTTCPSAPSAPLSPLATAGSSPGSATVSWAEPVTDGGNSLTGFVVVPFDATTGVTGSPVSIGPSATSTTLTGLRGGDRFTFAVSATNDVATGTSATSNPVSVVRSVTPLAPAPPPNGVPSTSLGTPTSVNASPTAPVTITQSSGGASAAVTVPAGALPSGTTVSVYPVVDTAPLVAQVPAGQSYVVSLVVAWQAPDGASPVATAPITMSVSDPGIKAGDKIYEVTTAGLVTVGTATVDGSATITFSNDPTFLIAATIQVAQSALTITTRTGTVGTALTLATSGGSGTGALTFSAVNGTASGCAISGSSLTASSAGTCVVTSTKAADATHLPVSSPPTTITLAAKALPVTLAVRGHAVAGETVTLTISGSGFYGLPTVTAHAGTTAVVTQVTGTLLTVKVTVKAGTINGVYSFTVRLANGTSYKVQYTQG
jgi:hypothetical protein